MSGQAAFELENTAPLDQQEELEDLDLPQQWYFGATLWSTDWTAETMVSQLRRGNLNLSPRYQRRQAWDAKRQSRFIESLILGLPVPQIILAEDHKRRGSFIVIDGKQRLLALRQFTAEHGDDFNPLRLAGLDDRRDLNGASYSDLKNSGDFRDDLNSFENQSIRTVVIRNWKDDRYLHSVFLRINTGSVQLSPQELRQALHPGGFSDFLDDASSQSAPLMELLNIKEPDFRMRDVELLLRYYAYFYFAASYKGNFKTFLDETVKQLNDSWEREKSKLQATNNEFAESLAVIRHVFGKEGELRKWNGDRYERRINRAVFDIMMYYLRSKPDRDAFVKAGGAIQDKFKRLCVDDIEFVSAIESTTKSIGANQTRFRRWADVLSQATGKPVRSPL